MPIDSPYEQGGLLEIELGGTTADSEYDVLAVTGLASFSEGSELQVQLIDAFGGDDIFQPDLGDMFDVVLADTIIDQGLVFDFPTLPGLEFAHEIIDTGSAQALRLKVMALLSRLAGDANRDGIVSADDYVSVQAHFGETGSPGILGDASYDGLVSADDYVAVQALFGQTVLPDGVGNASIVYEVNSIPEPASLSLVTLCAMLLLRRRSRCSSYLV